MRKTIISLLFIVLSFSINQVQALETKHQTNVLDLSNLFVSDDGNFLANTKKPINVNNNHTYTLVFGYDFLGQYAYYLDYTEVIVLEADDFEHYYQFIADDLMNRAYIEFIPTTQQIHLLDLPVAPFNDEAILYKGNYESFLGFEPYHENQLIQNQGFLYLDVNTSLSHAQIKQNITAKDPFGNTLNTEIIYNEYNETTNQLGTYRMIFETQYKNIKKQYILDIIIIDREAPILSIDGPLHLSFQNKLTLTEILALVTIEDNVDDLKIEDITILNDTYSTALLPGYYEIEIEVYDQSLNHTKLTIPIYLHDLNGPTIQGPSIIFVYTSQEPLTNEDIIKQFQISDDVDSEITVSVILNQYNQTKIPGIYNFRFRATDQSNNSEEKLVHIHVIENRAPAFDIDELIIEIEVGELMTEQELLQWFNNKFKQNGHEILNISIINNTYEKSNYQAGTHLIDFKYELQGEEQFSRVTLIVNETKPNIHLFIYSISATLIISGLVFYRLKNKKR